MHAGSWPAGLAPPPSSPARVPHGLVAGTPLEGSWKSAMTSQPVRPSFANEILNR